MVGQILPNNNERCYNNFSATEHTPNKEVFRERKVPEIKDQAHGSIRDSSARMLAEIRIRAYVS
jgi:hypothetical protein